MKNVLIGIAIFFSSIAISQTTDTATQKKDTVKRVGKRVAEGIVSHKYKECGTVILVPNKERHDTMTLIPMGNGLGEYDVEGLVISFQYRNLMIHNPKGCMKGGPVIVFDITKNETPKKSKKKKHATAASTTTK
jgi:hypothetical protein